MGLVVAAALLVACKPASKQVEQATDRAASWAVTVKAVTEQWAQSRVSLRFTRTTLNTAIQNLYRDAESIRSIDPAAASRITRLKNAIDPVMDAVALNEPDRARDAAAPLPLIMKPEPAEATARPGPPEGGPDNHAASER
jgi:hypothetical protein